jgi:hypothetical protein
LLRLRDVLVACTLNVCDSCRGLRWDAI